VIFEVKYSYTGEDSSLVLVLLMPTQVRAEVVVPTALSEPPDVILGFIRISAAAG
jgi:hypothetical protein